VATIPSLPYSYMTVSTEKLDTVIVTWEPGRTVSLSVLGSTHSRYTTTRSTEEVCGSKDLTVFGNYSGCQGSDTALLVV
jgi:hypothetical protein